MTRRNPPATDPIPVAPAGGVPSRTDATSLCRACNRAICDHTDTQWRG